MYPEIKWEEADKAVQVTRQSQVRFGSMGKDNESEQMQKNLLLRFPREIRNLITEYVLNLSDDAAKNVLIVSPPNPEVPLCEGLSILSLCKQITAEARSMLEARATASIPIMPDMNFRKLVSDVNENGNASLSEIQSTVLAGLTSFRYAHFHLHVDHISSPFPGCGGRHLGVNMAHIQDTLKEAVMIWRAASEHNFAHFRKQGLKRKAVVHLDDLFSDWVDPIERSKRHGLKDLLRLMDSDKTTDWEVHYYHCKHRHGTWRSGLPLPAVAY